MPQLILSLPSFDPALIRAVAAAGWKDVLLDLEHIPYTEPEVVAAWRAAKDAGMTAQLKMSDLHPDAYVRFLRFGVREFVLPHVEDASGVEAIFAEMGANPVPNRNAIKLYPLIESRAGIAAIPAICAAPGVAGVLLGAVDLALDLGFTIRSIADVEACGETLAPHLIAACDSIRASGKPNGCYLMRSWIDFFPLDRIDRVTLPLGALLAPSSLGIA